MSATAIIAYSVGALNALAAILTAVLAIARYQRKEGGKDEEDDD